MFQRNLLPLITQALLAIACLGGGPETRLLQEEPAEGRFVKTERGYMVPYQQRIPGSSAVIEMVPIPGGTITIDLPPPLSETDKPNPPDQMYTTSFGPFWMGRFEITMDQYMPYRRLYYEQKRADAKGENKVTNPTAVDAVTGPTEVYDTSYSFEYSGKPDSPATSASQFATRQYTKFLSLLTDQQYRLPLRSEWQHACLAGNQSRYHFGDDEKQLDAYAVYFDNVPDGSSTLRVGQKKPNAWGLHDMHGNVNEFVVEDTAVVGLRYGHVACGGSMNSDASECTYDSIVRAKHDWWDDDPDLPQSAWWMTSHDAQVTGFRIISPLKPMSPSEKRVYWDADTKELDQDVRYRISDGRGSVGQVKPPKPTTRRVDSTPIEP